MTHKEFKKLETAIGIDKINQILRKLFMDYEFSGIREDSNVNYDLTEKQIVIFNDTYYIGNAVFSDDVPLLQELDKIYKKAHRDHVINNLLDI